MGQVVVDFETYYDEQVSLSHLTYEQYIRHPEFEVIMASIKVDDEPAYIVVGSDNVKAELARIDLSDKLFIAHNCAFDAFILCDYFGLKAMAYACTMQMGRVVVNGGVRSSLQSLSDHYGLPPKGNTVVQMKGRKAASLSEAEVAAYTDYCLRDTENCYSLYHIFRPYFSRQDMTLISETLRWGAECQLDLDTPLLEEYAEKLRVERLERMQGLCVKYNVNPTELRSMLRSGVKFAQMLRDLGVEPPTKLNDKGKETYAFSKTDVQFKELLESDDKDVVQLVETKLGVQSSIAETRAESFLGVSKRGLMPFPLVPFGTHTGRHSATQQIALQNLPKRGGDTYLRRAMRAKQGNAILTCDSSQIEARRMAALAGQQDLLEQFGRGDDVYSIFGTGFFGRPVSKATKLERNISKEAVLSLQYGAGWASFKDRLKGAYGIDLSEDDARALVSYYRGVHTNITAFWNDCDTALQVMIDGGEFKFGTDDELTATKGMIVLADGWKLRYDGLKTNGVDDYGRAQYLYYSHKYKQHISIYSGMIANNVTQATSTRIFHWYIYQLKKRGLNMIGAVHDELIASVPITDVGYWANVMETVMKTTPDWASKTPVDCELDVGLNYGDQMGLQDFISKYGSE